MKLCIASVATTNNKSWHGNKIGNLLALLCTWHALSDVEMLPKNCVNYKKKTAEEIKQEQ